MLIRRRRRRPIEVAVDYSLAGRIFSLDSWHTAAEQFSPLSRRRFSRAGPTHAAPRCLSPNRSMTLSRIPPSSPSAKYTSSFPDDGLARCSGTRLSARHHGRRHFTAATSLNSSSSAISRGLSFDRGYNYRIKASDFTRSPSLKIITTANSGRSHVG